MSADDKIKLDALVAWKSEVESGMMTGSDKEALSSVCTWKTKVEAGETAVLIES